MAGPLDILHGGFVHGRRVHVLARHLAEFMPRDARVLDIGCGDGRIGMLIHEHRPDVQVTGIDISTRDTTHIPVEVFDGRHVPRGDREVDVVMLVDVLHHADDPHGLLADVARVARRAVVLKDVTPLGPFSEQTLRFMDWVGNARHGVPLPYDFWSQSQWREAFGTCGLGVEAVRRRFGIYPRPFGVLFERRMHFIARLSPAAAG